MSNFRPIDRDTAFLFPPSVDEWLPQRHLARYVVEVVEGLDLSEMVRAYRGSGSASYHPAMLLCAADLRLCHQGCFRAGRSSGRATIRWPFASSPPTRIPITTPSRGFGGGLSRRSRGCSWRC